MSRFVRSRGDSARDRSARRDSLVVIAEDLGQHVLFVRLDDGFLPTWPGNA
jgi:hypothetical protein